MIPIASLLETDPCAVRTQPDSKAAVSHQGLGCQLLVSIRDASEARLVRSLGVGWIDLKEPSHGALGAASLDTVQTVAQMLTAERPAVMSAAAGELRGIEGRPVEQLATYFPLIKVGLAGMAHENWQQPLVALARSVSSLGSQLVPVIYADYAASDAPAPEEVLAVCAGLDGSSPAQHTQRFVLVDTYIKDGRGLLHWMDLPQIAELVGACAQLRRQVVVAGSLRVQDVAELLQLPLAAVAVRGAVCAGDRAATISAEKVEQWLRLVENR